MSEVNFQKASAGKIKDYFSADNNHRYLLADEVGLGKTIVARNTIENMADKIKCCYYVCGSLALAEENLFKLRPEKLRYSSDYRNLKYFAPDRKLRQDYAVTLLSKCDRLTMGFVREEYNKRLRELMRYNKLYALYLVAENKNNIEFNKSKDKGMPESRAWQNLPDEYCSLFSGIQKDLINVVFMQKGQKSEKDKEAAGRGRNNEVILKLRELLLNSLADGNISGLSEFKKIPEPVNSSILEKAEKVYNDIVGIEEMPLISLTPLTSLKLSTPGKKEEKILINEILNSWQPDKKTSAGTDGDWSAFIRLLLASTPIMEKDNFNKITGDDKNDPIKAIKEYLAVYTLNGAYGNETKNLVIVDEFQNYSDVFNGSCDTSVGLVAKELLYNKNNYVLMLSATPFRYSTRVSDNGGEVSDGETNDNVSISGSRNIDKEVESILSYVLGNKKYEEWLEINKCRHEALKKADISGIEKYTGMQEQMLFSSGISRVERVNVPVDESDIVIDADRTLFDDIMSYPSLSIKPIYEPETGDKLIDMQNGQRYVMRIQGDRELLYVCTDDYIADIEFDDASDNGNEINVYMINIYNYDNGDIDYEIVPEIYADLCDEKESKKIIDKFKIRYGSLTIPEQYLKDTPYLFSFAEEYKSLKTDTQTPGYIIRKEDIEKGELPVKNARYANLKKAVFGEYNMNTKLLFIPPSNPHYKLSGVFEGYDDNEVFFSKTLIFSRYNHTPRALAAVLSFEAEAVNLSSGEKYDNNVRYHDLMEGTADQEVCIKAIIRDYIESDFKYSGNGDDDLMSNGNIAGYFVDLCKKMNGEVSCEQVFYDFEKTLTGIYKIFSTHSAYDIIKDTDDCGNYCDKIHKYCGQGCFRAVLDEYIFLLAEKNRFMEKEPEQQYEEIVKAMNSSIGVISNISNNIRAKNGIEIRTDFALGHYKGAGGENKTSDAKTLGNKLTAFNSPFRPFVFITTSVGQEGFDFHRYCRNIIHWSLIFDPVKFEQREGRINRYHGHHIRQNIGKKINLKPDFKMKYDFRDWQEMFDAFREKDGKGDGMSPDWVFPADQEQALSKLTRKAFYYPGSREVDGYKKLKEAVSYYRALLGQNKIDDIAEDNLIKIIKEYKPEEIEKLFIDLNPMHNNLSG